MSNHIIFTVASWEPRFALGIERVVAQYPAERIVMYFYAEYAQLSSQNRADVRLSCEKRNIAIEEHELSFADPIGSWTMLYKTASSTQFNNRPVVVDITTMPRETMWILFGFFDGNVASVTWTYHKPKGYNHDWLSRDPDRPRLVPKMGGVAKLGVPIKLMITSGFDVERARQLILFYEPEYILVGIQTGDQFDNQILNAARHIQEFQGSQRTRLFEVDAYSVDHGCERIENEIKEHLLDSNLIMASLGPKPSAIALYKIHRKHPQTSLAYAPSKEYNPEYSFGIAATIVGQL
jgi:hypothetical protein